MTYSCSFNEYLPFTTLCYCSEDSECISEEKKQVPFPSGGCILII